MKFLNFIKSLLQAEQGSSSGISDSEKSEKVSNTDACFNLEEWINCQKATYGSRKELYEDLERKASFFNCEASGLSGELLEELILQHPRMIPNGYWGGGLGWKSAKRKDRWEYLLTRNGVKASSSNNGLLISFFIDASEWVPHPYAPPYWVTFDFNLFSRYIVEDEDAFKLCLKWRMENSIALTKRLEDRLQRFSVQIGASYRCHYKTDCADVAFLLPDNGTSLLKVKTVWRGESALAELVKNIFPDTCREHSPSWLGGQRIDIYIPSLQVAIEYHGEQHYEPVEFFGGRKGFLSNKERDQRKAKACKDKGITLIEWKYTESIDEDNLQKKFLDLGIDWPER